MISARFSKSWLSLLLIVFFLTACTGGGSIPSPTQSFAISGWVFGEDQDGINKVILTYEGQMSGVATTLSSGSYSISGLKGPTKISASKEGWVFSEPQMVNKATTNVNFTGHIKAYALTVKRRGEGTVTETVLSSGQSADYPHGTIVELRAIPAGNWHFSHWEGGLSGRDNPATLTLLEPREVTAVFASGATIFGTITAKHNFPRSVVDKPTQTKVADTTTRIHANQTGMGSLVEHEPDQLILGFDASVPEGEIAKILNQLGYEVIDHLSILNAYLVKPAEDSLQGTMVRAMAVPGIRYAQPNNRIQPLTVFSPDDMLYPIQWHYPLIRLPQAWSVTTGDSSIRIAVIDSGVKKDHPDLASRLDFAYGYNFVGRNTNFDDDTGHGTHVTGTIGAVTDNNLGVAGVMWNVDILPIKVIDGAGNGDTWHLATGILYAAGLLNQPGQPLNPYPADVINISLGFSGSDDFVRQTIETVLSSTPTNHCCSRRKQQLVRRIPCSLPGSDRSGFCGLQLSQYP